MSKVSVVVPIYNVEQYLEKCIESIVNQTYGDLEIILVDDGSTDSSPSICDKWKEKDYRIVVIHKQNGGLSSARNAGMEMATGKYIMFEDSDDWLELDIVEKCVERIERDESDLVIFGYKKIDERGNNLGTFNFGNETYNNEEMSSQLHKRILEMSFGYAWNKLYRLSVIKKSGITSDGAIVDREDLYFNICLFNHLNKISYLDYVGYYYLQRDNSLLHNADLARLNGINYFCEKIVDIKWENHKAEKKVINMILLHYLSDVLIKNIIWNKKLKGKEKKNKIKNVITNLSCKVSLFEDDDNPHYLNLLCQGINGKSINKYYYYVKTSDLKKGLLKPRKCN